MPPKQPFSAQRAQEFGDLAVVKAIASFGHEGLPTGVLLDCTYRGVVTPDDGVDHGGEIAAKTTLVYIWNVVGGGFDDTQTKHVRADAAKKQGVPFPDTWRAALKCLQMSTLVGSALAAARQESDAAEIDCKFLGAARMKNAWRPWGDQARGNRHAGDKRHEHGLHPLRTGTWKLLAVPSGPVR